MNTEREQLLISRVTDGEATDQEWHELEALAERDRRLWRALAESQRDYIGLTGAMTKAAWVAETIPLPSRTVQSSSHAPTATSSTRLGWARAWAGWAVAAIVCFVAGPRLWQTPPPNTVTPANQTRLAQITPITSVADAFQTYLDKGRLSGEVIGEMPTKVLVETRPMPAGQGYELLYLRQVLERAVVPDLYQVDGHDELGQPTLVRYEHPVRSSM